MAAGDEDQLAAGAVDAVACAGRGVIAAGETLSRVDLEGAAEPPADLSWGELVATASVRGGVRVRYDVKRVNPEIIGAVPSAKAITVRLA